MVWNQLEYKTQTISWNKQYVTYCMLIRVEHEYIWNIFAAHGSDF